MGDLAVSGRAVPRFVGGQVARAYNRLTMQYQVFIQSQADHSYVAAVIGMPDCIVEGQTKEEAIAKVKAALEARLAQGEVVTIEVEPPNEPESHPLLKHFGRFRDDSTFEDFQEKVAEYRRQLDEDNAAQ